MTFVILRLIFVAIAILSLACNAGPTAIPELQPTPTATVDQPRVAPLRTPTPVPTVTLAPVPTPTSVPTSTPIPPKPTATPILVPTPTPTAVPLPTNTPPPVPTATPKPSPTPVPTATSVPAPTLEDLQTYMLVLINEARHNAGLHRVALGDNSAAQLHAEASLAGCFSSHWGLDGLKPHMRYSAAGGYQVNSENVSGRDYCVTASDSYRPVTSNIRGAIKNAVDWLILSPDHYKTITRPYYRKVNIGIAFDDYNLKVVQQFEGDYVTFDQLPSLADGQLVLSGHVRNGVTLHPTNTSISLFYDPLPSPLTLGQIARIYGVTESLRVASIRKPGSYRNSPDHVVRTYSTYQDPHSLPADSPAPSSPEEARELWEQAKATSKIEEEITVPWITADERNVTDTEFYLSADISSVLAEHGAGVYKVVMWGMLDGKSVTIAEYPITWHR